MQHYVAADASAALCAYFLKRAHQLLTIRGTSGFISTKTIAQGDTRRVGLDQILEDSDIYYAVSSTPWPGSAGVHISVICFFRGKWKGVRVLDELHVTSISSSL